MRTAQGGLADEGLAVALAVAGGPAAATAPCGAGPFGLAAAAPAAATAAATAPAVLAAASVASVVGTPPPSTAPVGPPTGAGGSAPRCHAARAAGPGPKGGVLPVLPLLLYLTSTAGSATPCPSAEGPAGPGSTTAAAAVPLPAAGDGVAVLCPVPCAAVSSCFCCCIVNVTMSTGRRPAATSSAGSPCTSIQAHCTQPRMLVRSLFAQRHWCVWK